MKYDVDPEEVYDLVADEPRSTREIASELGVPFTAAQNHLRRLHVDDRIETTTPRSYDARAKWVVPDG